jgi:two-component system, NtrC family, sensor kinase
MSAPAEIRALLDALPMPAMLVAEDGELLHANAAASAQPPAGDGAPLVLPRIGACRLIAAPPPDPQTQRLASLGFMLASVCHEISNPLAAVSSMLQILQSKRAVTAETLEKGLASIAANIARVHAITKKLGAYSRVGGDAPAPRAIDDAVEAAAALLRHSPCGEGVRLDYRGAPGETVRARPGEFEQVLFNIFLNAAQAMHGAGRIEANAKKENGRITVSIRDTGPGIAPEHLARVFDPFFTTKQPGEGTGLGLAVSYEIVHELGGTLHAANDPHGGARFEIVLPA